MYIYGKRKWVNGKDKGKDKDKDKGKDKGKDKEKRYLRKAC